MCACPELQEAIVVSAQPSKAIDASAFIYIYIYIFFFLSGRVCADLFVVLVFVVVSRGDYVRFVGTATANK